jgi:hypothetical protein
MDFYSASSLKQQSRVRHVTPLGHNIQIQSLSQPIIGLLLNAAPLVEKISQPINGLLLNAAPLVEKKQIHIS